MADRLKGNLSDVTATPSEVNRLTGVRPGERTASKAVVAGASGEIDALDVTTLSVGGTAITATASEVNTPLDGAHLVQARQVDFTEEGAGTYTGTISLPAGAIIHDIIVVAVALWDAATSASLEVGDSGDDDGFFTAVDLKATDLLAEESVNLNGRSGGVQGAYVSGTLTHVTDRYAAAARDIVATVVSVGAGTAGRTRVIVSYSVPESTAATFVAA